MRIFFSVALAMLVVTLYTRPAAAGLMGPPPQIGDSYQYGVSDESDSPNGSFTESTHVIVRNWLNDAQIQPVDDSRFAMLFFNDIRAIADSAPESPKAGDVWSTAVAVPIIGDAAMSLRLSVKVDNVADGRTDVEFSGLTNQTVLVDGKPASDAIFVSGSASFVNGALEAAGGQQTEVLGPGAARAGQWTRSWSVAQE
jgi:hypothetical protein